MSSTQTIRKRLLEAGVSFAPNDNIAEHLRPGDIEVIQAEVERHMQAVLDALVHRYQSRPQQSGDGGANCQNVRARGVRRPL